MTKWRANEETEEESSKTRPDEGRPDNEGQLFRKQLWLLKNWRKALVQTGPTVINDWKKANTDYWKPVNWPMTKPYSDGCLVA